MNWAMAGYALHEMLVSPARPTATVRRIAGSVALIVAGFMVLNVFYFQLLSHLPDWPAIYHELAEGSSPRAVWVLLANFIPLLVVLSVVFWQVHGRMLHELLGPVGLCLADMRRVVRLMIPLYLVVFLVPMPSEFSAMPHLALSSWLALVPVSLFLILIQVTAEEILFRGYLQSHLAARFSSPLVWMVLPSALFAFLHYDPVTFGPNAMTTAGLTGLFALAAADVTARAGNLGPALIFHFVNNVFALMFAAMAGHWDGVALYTFPYDPSDADLIRSALPGEVLVILCGWLVARLAIRR